MFVNSGPDLTLQNLTIANGKAGAGDGGGIFNSGTLTVTNSTNSGNTANNGGGIRNGGTMTITNSTFSSNSEVNSGGAISNGPGGTVSVINSTFWSNSAEVGGSIRTGAIFNIKNSIVGNSPSGGDCSGSWWHFQRPRQELRHRRHLRGPRLRFH